MNYTCFITTLSDGSMWITEFKGGSSAASGSFQALSPQLSALSCNTGLPTVGPAKDGGVA